MIINSKFKDYYDYVAHQYRDEKVVWERKTVRYMRECPADLLRASSELTRDISGWSREFEGVYALLIAGRVYQFHHKQYLNSCYQYINDFSFDESMTKPVKSRLMRNSLYRQYQFGERVTKFSEINLKHSPIIYFGPNETCLSPCFNKREDIPKVLDAWSMVQEVMTCLSSVEPHIPIPENDVRLEGHGFDKKTSFRHRK